jgi:hypothetical protein
MHCCGQRVCNACMLGSLKACVCHERPRFRIACPFCRQKCGVDEWKVKEAMAAHCPSHATVVENSCDEARVVIAHTACGGGKGCYDCAESTLTLCEL